MSQSKDSWRLVLTIVKYAITLLIGYLGGSGDITSTLL